MFCEKRIILHTFLHIHAKYWTDWTAPEVADGVLDHVAPRLMKNMSTKGEKKK